MARAFIFPGQGSQAVGMGQALSLASAAAREVFQEVDEALGQNLSKLMFEGPEADLTLTENAQPAIMANAIAALRVLEKEGGLLLADKAAYVAGHSLGEYTALCAAGSLGLAETARLLKLRGQAMQAAVPVGEGAMAALLGLDFEAAVKAAAEGAQGEVCQAANDNAPGQVVLSGTFDGLEAATAGLHEAGVRKIVPLKVAGPFHSPLMTGAAKAFGTLLAGATFADAAIPVIQNTDPTPTSDAAMIRQRLLGQITSPVRWTETMRALLAAGVEVAIECGPGSVLAGLARRVDGLTVLSAEDAGLDRVMEVLAA